MILEYWLILHFFSVLKKEQKVPNRQQTNKAVNRQKYPEVLTLYLIIQINTAIVVTGPVVNLDSSFLIALTIFAKRC